VTVRRGRRRRASCIWRRRQVLTTDLPRAGAGSVRTMRVTACWRPNNDPLYFNFFVGTKVRSPWEEVSMALAWHGMDPRPQRFHGQDRRMIKKYLPRLSLLLGLVWPPSYPEQRKSNNYRLQRSTDRESVYSHNYQLPGQMQYNYRRRCKKKKMFL
jgi:hypothetical protein